MAKRKSWEEYFIDIVNTIAERATCNRGKSGAIIVKNKRILSTGYVGSPIGLPHCDDVGHQFKKTIHEDGHVTNHCIRTVHAEQNAICQAARYGVPIDGSTLYCTMLPCYTCAKMIINSGIKKVVCIKDYHAGDETKEVFAQAGISLKIINKEVMKYDKM